MTFDLPRVGAFAPAAILFVTFLGAEAGAWAQDQGPIAASEAVEVAAQPDAPRFVAHEVVQPLPTEEPTEAGVAQAASLQELVADMPVSEPLAADLRCLAQALYFESRGEPLTGQLAVARVVINRSASDLYPGDYCSVVTQRAQFSFVRNGRIPRA